MNTESSGNGRFRLTRLDVAVLAGLLALQTFAFTTITNSKLADLRLEISRNYTPQTAIATPSDIRDLQRQVDTLRAEVKEVRDAFNRHMEEFRRPAIR